MGFSRRRRVWDLFVGTLTCLASTALAGCTLDAQSGEDSDEDVGSVRSALVPDGPFAWGELTNSQRRMILTDTRGNYDARACFLTGLHGKFEGGSEWIQVVKEGVGIFELSAHTGQGNEGPLGEAACVGNTIGYRGSWRIGDRKLPLRRGGTCFLTRVEGKFSGGSEWVGVWQEGDQWYLGGDTRQRETIAASAGCVAAPQLLRVEQQGADWDVRLTSKAHTACFLQVVRGGFRSHAQGLRIWTGSSTGFWHLNAPSEGTFIHGGAGCIDASHTELGP